MPPHVWSESFGDEFDDWGRAIATDEAGYFIVTGHFAGTANFGGGDLTSAGGADIFVAKFGPAGNHVWSRRFGGSYSDVGYGIAIDGAGNVVVTGHFQDTVDFGGGPLESDDGSFDIFVAKFDPTGAHLWSQRFGGPDADRGRDIAVDGAGNVLVTGEFRNTVSFGGDLLSSAGSYDVFVAKYNANGYHLWSSAFGGTGSDRGYAIATDGTNCLVAGCFQDMVDFGGGTLTSAGGDDIFLAKYNPIGGHLWSQRFGDELVDGGDVKGPDIAVDGVGSILLTGGFRGTVDFGGGPLESTGEWDMFITKRDGATGGHLWSQSFEGGAGWEDPHGIAVDGVGNIVATGAFEGWVNFGGDTLIVAGPPGTMKDDIFVVKFGPLSVWIEGPQQLDPGQPGTFEAIVSGGVPPYTYEWYKGNHCNTNRWTRVGGNSPQVTIKSRSTFCLKVVVTDDVGESTHRTYKVYVDEPIPEGLPAAVGVSSHALRQNVPNPFNPVTQISFDLPVASRVSLVIYDVHGKRVAELVNGPKAAGTHTVPFSAEHLASGIYFYRLVAGDYTAVRKMVLMK